MTALQMARDECANWLGGGCLGAMIDDDLQTRRCCPKPKCVLGTPGERCRYFEECVAPMARGREEFAAAVQDYRRATQLPCAAERSCPICGRPMEPRERFCDDCAAARNRTNQRTWLQERRRVGMSKVKPISALGHQELTRAV